MLRSCEVKRQFAVELIKCIWVSPRWIRNCQDLFGFDVARMDFKVLCILFAFPSPSIDKTLFCHFCRVAKLLAFGTFQWYVKVFGYKSSRYHRTHTVGMILYQNLCAASHDFSSCHFHVTLWLCFELNCITCAHHRRTAFGNKTSSQFFCDVKKGFHFDTANYKQ